MRLSDYKSTADEEVLNDVIGKYEGMSQSELAEALTAEVRKAKEKGDFNAEELESFIGMITPYLNAEQMEKLENLIEVIKLEN